MDKSKILFFVIIGLLVVLIGVIGVVSFKAFSIIGSDETETENSATQQSGNVSKENITILDLTSPISTNLKTGPSGIDYAIRVSIGIGINNTDPDAAAPIIELLSTKETMVRDICLSVITNMTYEELTAGDAQAILSKAILQRLQEEFETNLIYDVYVSDIYYN